MGVCHGHSNPLARLFVRPDSDSAYLAAIACVTAWIAFKQKVISLKSDVKASLSNKS